ncbi:MAG: hypothetical protein IIV68_06790 [Alistipes sp.]|nr:hypothetical protein [Alistipes sp.]
MMRIFNPFRYIAGTKSLVFGLIFIATSTLLLYSGGYIQDSYIHIGMAAAPLWKVAAMQILWWILPAGILYLCGLLLSKSKIRIIDILGTTAFAQLILLLMIAPMLLPAVQNSTLEVVATLQSGGVPTPGLPLMIYSVWSFICIAFFYIWNYNAFAVSCNVSGWKAIATYIGVQAMITVVCALL